ncbi:MAG: hypothetical protein ABR511_11160 [Acidimicrobiales bacterium]
MTVAACLCEDCGHAIPGCECDLEPACTDCGEAIEADYPELIKERRCLRCAENYLFGRL